MTTIALPTSRRRSWRWLVLTALVLTTNIVTIAASFAALAITVAYPYAKRWVSMPQAVLGLAFSVGIPMAYLAVQGDGVWGWQAAWQTVPASAWWLLLGNVFWVLAYDTEYAMVDRDDDLLIGMKTSAITLGRWDVTAVMAFYALFLLIWTGVLWQSGLKPWWWLGIAVAAGQVVWHGSLIRSRTREGCFKAFRANHWVGMALFVGIAVSQ